LRAFTGFVHGISPATARLGGRALQGIAAMYRYVLNEIRM
jgi:hypothetical protein